PSSHSLAADDLKTAKRRCRVPLSEPMRAYVTESNFCVCGLAEIQNGQPVLAVSAEAASSFEGTTDGSNQWSKEAIFFCRHYKRYVRGRANREGSVERCRVVFRSGAAEINIKRPFGCFRVPPSASTIYSYGAPIVGRVRIAGIVIPIR